MYKVQTPDAIWYENTSEDVVNALFDPKVYGPFDPKDTTDTARREMYYALRNALVWDGELAPNFWVTVWWDN